MLSVLRSLLAEIAPSLLKNQLQKDRAETARRDMLSVKRNPPPFGQRGAGKGRTVEKPGRAKPR